MKNSTIRIVADFETVVYEGQMDTAVWAAGWCELGSENVIIRGCIEDFFNDLFKKNRNIVGWFHNLKFDGTFIIDSLLKQGYKWQNRPIKDMSPMSFKALISSKQRFYSLTIVTKYMRVIEFRDSAKLIPFSLRAAAKAFNTPHQKLSMVYEGKRYPNCAITPNERLYIINDVLVLKELMEIIIKRNMDKLTIGSVCLSDFKNGYDKWEFDSYFPNYKDIPCEVDSELTTDSYIRKTYKGAWCYVKESGVYYDGVTLDVNSLYTSVMHSKSGNYYPVGYPHYFKGGIPDICNKEDIVWFVHIKCRFQLKEGFLPTIQIKNSFLYASNEWLKTSDFKVRGKYADRITKDGKEYIAYPDLYLTMKDYELLLKHYNVEDLVIIDGVWFTGVLGIFDTYCNKWFERKQNATDKVERTIDKLYLNNLYGKLATSDDGSYLVPYLKDGVVCYEVEENNDKPTMAIPAGSMVTSYARFFTISHAQENYGLFLYADTDSIHGLNGAYKGIEIHETNLLCWKKEAHWRKAIFLRQKTYAEFIDESDGQKVYPKWKITCAGMPESTKEEFLKTHPITDFKYGLRMTHGRLRPKRIPGGMILVEEPFQLKKH